MLREMHHFEYYVLHKKLAWLLCENNHGVLFAVGEDMPEELRRASGGSGSRGEPQ